MLAHARALLTSDPEAVSPAYLDADLRDTDQVLERAADPWTSASRWPSCCWPSCTTSPDLAEAKRIMARLISAVPPGSYVTMSHAASDTPPSEMAELIRRVNQHLAEANHVGRPREMVAELFEGLELLEPGVVKVTQWRPESKQEAEGPTSLWGGVGRKN